MSRFTPDAAAALEGPAWLHARRTAAAERFAAATLPTQEEEIWRYSRVSQIDLDAYTPAGAPINGHGSHGGHGPTACPRAWPTCSTGPEPAPGCSWSTTAGWCVRELDAALADRGVVLADAIDLPDTDGDRVLAASDTDADAFTELNGAFLRGVAYLRVPPGVEIADPDPDPALVRRRGPRWWRPRR